MAKQKVRTQSGGIGEFFSTLFWALLIAMLVRTLLFQPFHIPSGSMQPNLLVGDYIITSKYSVGYGKYAADPIPLPIEEGRLLERQPARGDIVVFRPEGLRKNFIKRLVGLPGDEIQMIDGVLNVNNEPVLLERLGADAAIENAVTENAEFWREQFPEGHIHTILDAEKNSVSDNTTIYTVPDGFYFMMGDNRDHSGDSRRDVSEGGAGLIPAENIIGRAEFILLSVTENFSIVRPWTWHNLRGGRFMVGLR